MTDWSGCYNDNWQGIIVPEAFSHPVKYSRGLIAHIYQHMLENGWLHRGDVVLDPFGGVALGGFEAMRLGLNWVGVELEPKFYSMGNQNIAKWCKDYPGMLPGSAVLLQGDSRRLGEVIAEAGAVVSSPPYADTPIKQTHMTSNKRGDPDNPNYRPSWKTKLADGYADTVRPYGSTPGQLGVMKPGDLDAIISSPPFVDQIVSDHNFQAPHDTTALMDVHKVNSFSPGQLGSMKPGTFDNVISSPPYADQVIRDRDLGKEGFTQGATQGKHAFDAYGHTPGQLGSMKPGDLDATVSSPPYETMNSTDIKFMQKHADDTGRDFQKPGGRSLIGQYGTTAGNIGNAAGDTFWQAAREIVAQCYAILRPGAYTAWVVKGYIKNKKLVDFPGQWRLLCEACGFEFVEEIHASLVKETHIGNDLFSGEVVTKRTERKSFFRRLAEKNGSPHIDFETVLFLRKLGQDAGGGTGLVPPVASAPEG